MCLGEVALVLELVPGGSAVVRFGQRTTTVSLLTLDGTVAPGDWVVCHSGVSLGRLTAEEAAEATDIRATTAARATGPPHDRPPRKDTP